jgi:hypothetical protein
MSLSVWNSFARPPREALKPIGGGRLRGKTDINPQWRMQVMTDVFGVCGFGWKYTVDRQWTEQGDAGEIFAFVNISIFIKMNGEWSDAIPGSGGHFLVEKEKEGLHNNDEAFKMATTDALSVAMKTLGVAAEIYLGNWDGSKYRTVPPDQNNGKEKHEPPKPPTAKPATRKLFWSEMDPAQRMTWPAKVIQAIHDATDQAALEVCWDKIVERKLYGETLDNLGKLIHDKSKDEEFRIRLLQEADAMQDAAQETAPA